MAWRIGADIGGTFIDFCALEVGSNRLEALKVLTTPDEPGRELMHGLTLLEREHGVDPADIEAFVHGTTVGINTIIQRKGAKMALVTTAGFEDVIELAPLALARNVFAVLREARTADLARPRLRRSRAHAGRRRRGRGAR